MTSTRANGSGAPAGAPPQPRTPDGGSPPGRQSRRGWETRSSRARYRRAEALAAHLEPALRLLRGVTPPDKPEQLRRWLATTVHDRPDLGDQLFAAYTPPVEAPARSSTSEQTHAKPPGRAARAFIWFLAHVWNAPSVVFLVATGAALTAYLVFVNHPAWRLPVLDAFLVLLPTLLPGFLYLRFITFRIGPLRDEYVYNLHRLGVDAPEHLPEPPRPSHAWQRWNDHGGPYLHDKRNISRSKFESQYGRWPASDSDVHKESLGRLMSLYLCLVVLAVGWAGVVWTTPVGASLPRQADALRFGFLGAYFALLSLLVRRYFQNDLRPGAYLSGVVRIVTVLLLVVAVDQAFALQGAPADRPHAALNVVAFLVGVFPSVGMQFLRRAVGKLTGALRGGLEPPFPLSQLDGMDIWSEARLLEVGIEDVQHLATANLVDVTLGARLPTQRVVDWVDQAMLLLRTGLPRTDNLRQPTTYAQLREVGVRSSTDLLEVAMDLQLNLAPDGRWPCQGTPAGALMAVPAAGTRSGKRGEVLPSTVPLLTRMALAATTLRHEPNLPLVQHWHRTESEGPDRGPGGDVPPKTLDLLRLYKAVSGR